MDLSSKIEAVLFVAGEPVTIDKLAKVCGAKTLEIQEALKNLKERFLTGGLRLLELGDGVELATADEAAPFVEEFLKDEFKEELTPASLETLAVVIQEGPISRSRIDDIRGVDSRFILRHLTVRGLVKKIDNPDDLRIPQYDLTFDLLKYFGAADKEELKSLIDKAPSEK